MTKPPTRNCDLCCHLRWEPDETEGATCTQGHKLRWYHPHSPMDEFYGYKRRCSDYLEETETPR